MVSCKLFTGLAALAAVSTYGLEDQRVEHHADHAADIAVSLKDSPQTAAGSRRQLAGKDRSPPFQIKSIERPDLCIQASVLAKKEPLAIQECDNNEGKQKWTADDDGRLRSKDDDTLCMQQGGKKIRLGRCGSVRSWKNQFAFDAFDDTIKSRKNGRKTLGIADLNEPLAGKDILAGLDLSLKTWSIDPPTIFVSKGDIPSEFQIKSKLNSLCLTSSKAGQNPRLLECGTSMIQQVWEVDSSGRIGTSRTANKKCLFKGEDATLKNGGGGCHGKKSVFMYDAFTSSIIHERGGAWAFSVDVNLNEVVLMRQGSSKKALQEWSLEAV